MKNKEKYAKEMCQFLIGKVQQAYPADNSEDLEEEDGVNSS